MKSYKLIATSLLAAAAVTAASAADIVIKITGSTAFRKAEYAGIVDWLTTNRGAVSGAFVTNSGATLNGANQAIFVAGVTPNKVTIQCGQGGSSGGLRFTAQGLPASTQPDGSLTNQVWISPSVTMSSVTLSGGQATGGTSYTTAGATFDAPAVADITMADTFQDSTQWNSTDYTALNEVSGGALGMQDYQFSKGQNYTNVPAASYARFVNMSGVGFQTLAANGVAPLALFTATDADSGIDVVLVGRDYDSGTRCVTFYETGYGNDTTAAKQYRAQDAANIDVGDGTGAGNIDHLVQALNAGDLAGSANLAGYNSGGYVKNVLNKAGGTVLSPRGRPAILVGYLSSGDAGGVALTFNGVARSTPTVAYGQYSFWDAEHMYYNVLAGSFTTVANTQKYVAGQIANLIRSTDITASSAVAISAMHASKGTDGAVIGTTLP